MSPIVLQPGSCERLKASTHALAMGVAAVCAAYNLTAWIVRRQRHLAINAVVYGAAVYWEAQHVQHHLAACAPKPAKPVQERLRAVS